MNKPRPWWLRKRLLLPIAALFLFVLVLIYAAASSNNSKIMVSNETASPIHGVEILACGQRFAIAVIAPDESVRFDLEPGGDTGNVLFTVAGTTNWNSSTHFIAPTGGHRLVFRLRPGGWLESRQYRSWFQEYILGRQPPATGPPPGARASTPAYTVRGSMRGSLPGISVAGG